MPIVPSTRTECAGQKGRENFNVDTVVAVGWLKIKEQPEGDSKSNRQKNARDLAQRSRRGSAFGGVNLKYNLLMEKR